MNVERTNEERVNPLCWLVAWLFFNALAAWGSLVFRACSPVICAWCGKTTRRQWIPARLLGRRLRPSHGICGACAKQWGRG